MKDLNRAFSNFGLRQLLIAVLILVQAAPVNAFAMSGFFPNPCPALFTKLFPAKIKSDPEKYLALRETAISKYFPESELLRPQPGVELLGAKVSPDSLKEFHAEFDSLLDQRGVTFKLPVEKFRAWLKSKSKTGAPYPEIDPVYLEQAFKANGSTLEDVQNVYFLQFAKETHKADVAGLLKTLRVEEIARLGLTASKKIGTVGWGIISGALVAGPVAQVLNSFLNAPLKPILESSEQASNILLSSVSQVVQKFASEKIKGLKQQMSELAAATDALDQYNFNGMDPKEAKVIMDELESRYYKVFLRMNAFMPSYKRAGREIVRDWLIIQPLQLANHATTFNMEFTMNQALLSALEEKIKARATPATAEEKELIENFKNNMESAENRLAVTLASWKLYTFAFAEVSREPQVKDSNAVLMDTLGRYEKFMNMDKYRRELSAKVKEAFHNFDPTFTGMEKLQTPRQEISK